jgi:predicted ATPase/DNA-binding SARP family transcriptional activator
MSSAVLIPTAAPAAPSVQMPLPVHLTRFIGRTTELQEIARMLAATRLLTLTGAGGSGKTRLAREAAAVASPDFSNVGWVDLASITEAALLPQQVATALHLPDRAVESAVDSLSTSIGNEPTLLVLDNCEHLVDACAVLVERLLRECARLCVLATSREALGIPSETAWLVPPLAGSEAIQLFVERAQAALPSFAALDANMSAVADICRRLDGIPLAIELAAARVRVLSPEQIACRLDDVFRLLTTGSRTALPRHRTLRGTMDWSYGLLDDREQRLLRRLSVFAGTFSLEAAEAVCTAAPLEVEDILDGVAALVDKSLVVMDACDGAARYRLLETVKQYGVELLDASGELDEFRARHGEYFLGIVERVAPLLIGGEHRPGLLARVGLDHDNVRAASMWALRDPARATEALRFAGALFWFWYGMSYQLKSGQFREARKYVDAALARADGAQPLVHGRALLASGLTALAQGENARARTDFIASFDIIDIHGDDVLRAYVMAKLGASYLMLGDVPRAMEILERAFELSKSLEPQVVHAFVMYWRGTGACLLGNRELAREMCQANNELAQLLSHRTTFAHTSSQLGLIALLEGKQEEAFARLSDAIRMHLEIGDAWGLANDLDAMANLAMQRERTVDAVRLIGAVDHLRERVAIGMPATERERREVLIASARRELGDAYAGVYDEGRRIEMEQVVQLARDAGGMHTAEYRVPIFDNDALAAGLATPAAKKVTMRVLGLGPLQVFVNDEPIESAAWGSARPRELLLYLLMHPDGRTKEQVGLAFWPEASSAQLRNSFHVTLHRLRKALRTPEWITVVNDRYRVDPAILEEFDVVTFERDLGMARRALKRQEKEAAHALERALCLYRGDFLDGEPAGDWHLEHRERLQRIFVDALMELGLHHTADGRHATAADVYRRVLARDELHEDAALGLMQSLALLGERAQALRFYQRFADTMRRELEAEPGEELVELHEELKAGSTSA